MTFGPRGTVVYRNGTQAQLFRRFKISTHDLSGQIVLGTSPVIVEPWEGQVRGLALYSKELTPEEVAGHYGDWTGVNSHAAPDLDHAIAHYRFDEHSGREIHSTVPVAPSLIIPCSFDVPHKAVLASAVKEFEPTRVYLHDVIVNILGFVPLGAILCVYFSLQGSRSKAVIKATLFGAALSFVIEVLQGFIPSRGSGMTDVITNTTGTFLGAVILHPDFIRSVLRFVGFLPDEVNPSRANGEFEAEL
jgi:VanZ family protein